MVVPTLRHRDEHPDEQRWRKLERIIESLSAQIQVHDDAGGFESERVGGLERTTRSIREAAQNLARRQEAGAMSPNDHLGSDSLAGKLVVPEGVTSQSCFNQ